MPIWIRRRKKELEMADIKVRTVGEMRQAILSEAKKIYNNTE